MTLLSSEFFSNFLLSITTELFLSFLPPDRSSDQWDHSIPIHLIPYPSRLLCYFYIFLPHTLFMPMGWFCFLCMQHVCMWTGWTVLPAPSRKKGLPERSVTVSVCLPPMNICHVCIKPHLNNSSWPRQCQTLVWEHLSSNTALTVLPTLPQKGRTGRLFTPHPAPATYHLPLPPEQEGRRIFAEQNKHTARTAAGNP